MTNFNYQGSEIFGKYCKIPMNAKGEKHLFKCIGLLQSNTYMDVPICPYHEMAIHDNITDVVNVIHCGIDESEVIRVAMKDIEIIDDNPPLSFEGLIRMEGLPVWDNADKVWLIVGETYKPFAFDAPIYEDALSVELRGSNCASDLIITNNFKHHEKFNPNRFYRKQVGNGDDSHA